MQLAEEDQLFNDLHLLVEAALFRQIADALQALAIERLPKEADLTRVRNRDAHHHANGTGLARSVRNEQAEHLACIDGEAQVIDSDLVLVGLRNTRKFTNWHGFSPRFLPADGPWGN